MKRKILLTGGLIVGALALFVGLLFVTNPAHADDDPSLDARGIVMTMPAGSLYGTWTIGGNAYEAVNGITRFEQEYGPIA